MRATGSNGETGSVDLNPLREVVPDLETWHVRLCGNAVARTQFQRGLEQSGSSCLSLRSETW